MTGLRYLKRTEDGLLGVYDDASFALNAARALRKRKPAAGMRILYGLHFGDTFLSSDGFPCGGEPQMLREVLSVRREDRVVGSGNAEVPDRDRVMLPRGALVQLPIELRAQFLPLGLFMIRGYDCPIEIWTESLAALLGREPTESERLFGVEGAHRETVLDLWQQRRYSLLDKNTKK